MNTSSAVMQQRTEPWDSLDDYPTPPWATRALCEWLGPGLERLHCHEPSANRGHMVRPLGEYFEWVTAADIHDYGAGYPIADYLTAPRELVDWTITNPPFRLAEEFIKRSFYSSTNTAVIVRIAFLEGIGRLERLFSLDPPTDILQFSERVTMYKGRLTAKGGSATAYCWLVWRGTEMRTNFHWIPPCRKRLERASDYT